MTQLFFFNYLVVNQDDNYIQVGNDVYLQWSFNKVWKGIRWRDEQYGYNLAFKNGY